MSRESEETGVAKRLEDIAWFSGVADRSQQVMRGVPPEDQSSWYRSLEARLQRP